MSIVLMLVGPVCCPARSMPLVVSSLDAIGPRPLFSYKVHDFMVESRCYFLGPSTICRDHALLVRIPDS